MCTQGVTAFLERTNWAKACGGEARPLLPGTLMEVVVTAAPKQARMLPCCPRKILRAEHADTCCMMSLLSC